MKPQTQRWNRGPVYSAGDKQTDAGGDCFAACIASILEVPIDGFPNFLASIDNKTWWDRWIDFLYMEFRQTLLYWEDELPNPKDLAWWIGEVQPGSFPHSVVFYQEKFKWDPLPAYKREYTVDDVKSIVAIYSIGSILK